MQRRCRGGIRGSAQVLTPKALRTGMPKLGKRRRSMRAIIQVAISTWISACNSSTMVPTGSRNGRSLGWKIFGMIQFARNPTPTKMPTKMRRRQPARKPRELRKILLISGKPPAETPLVPVFKPPQGVYTQDPVSERGEYILAFPGQQPFHALRKLPADPKLDLRSDLHRPDDSCASISRFLEFETDSQRT